MSTSILRPVLRVGRSHPSLRESVRTTSIKTRAFSATASMQMGKIIEFEVFRNKELEAILSKIYNNIILPAYLPLSQRRRIFRGRWKHLLSQDPIEIELGNRKIRFRHIDRTAGEVPNARKSLYQAIDHMRTHAEWQVLPKLLEGLWYHAQLRFQPTDWPKIIRKAGKAGELSGIFEAMQRPQRTGMRLDASETVQELLSAIVWEAGEALWDERACERALRQAERVWAALAHEDHQLGPAAREALAAKGRYPLARDPQLLAVPMLAAAYLVVDHGKASAYVDTLRRYATVVTAVWPAGKGLLELHPNEAYVDPQGMEYLMDKNRFLTVAAPILRGFELGAEALKNSDKELSEKLQARVGPVREEVQAALKAQEMHVDHKRGRSMYDLTYRRLSKNEVAAMKKAKAEKP